MRGIWVGLEATEKAVRFEPKPGHFGHFSFLVKCARSIFARPFDNRKALLRDSFRVDVSISKDIRTLAIDGVDRGLGELRGEDEMGDLDADRDHFFCLHLILISTEGSSLGNKHSWLDNSTWRESELYSSR